MSVFVATAETKRRVSRVASRSAACAAALMLTYGAGAIGSCPVVGVASAHDVVLHSTPADGATVSTFPRHIVLEFSAIPKETFNTIAVSNADTSTVLYSGKPMRDKQMMSIDIPSSVVAGDGHYTIGYQITSSDGHATRGKLGFTVASAAGSPTQDTRASRAASTSTDNPSSSASTQVAKNIEGDSGLASWIFGGAGLAIGAAVIAVVVKKRRGA